MPSRTGAASCGSAKYARVLRGRGYFAEVDVEVMPDQTHTTVEDACSGGGFRSQGYFEDAPDRGYDDWKAGTVQGVNYGLALANRGPCHVRILRISGLTTDTTPATVGCAATLAILAALDVAPPANLQDRLDQLALSGPEFSAPTSE